MNRAGSIGPRPWRWVPTLYFAQGIPYVVVMTVSVIMYKRLGISNTAIALYTSWLYLPWVIKALWSPFVDMFGTKRFWIVCLQVVVGAGMASVALTLPLPNFFQYTLAILWLMAFASATHDIAADGFYMLALPEHQQAAFSGVRNTFYRIATIAAQGALVMLAGAIESRSGLPPVELTVVASPGEQSASWESWTPPTGEGDAPRILASHSELKIDTAARPVEEARKAISAVREWNLAHGFTTADEPAAQKKSDDPKSAGLVSWLENTITRTFGKPPAKKQALAGNVGVVALRLSAPPPEDRPYVVNITQAGGDKDIALAEGGRLTFTRENWNQPALVAFQLDAKLARPARAEFEALAGNSILAWVICFGVLGVVFLLLAGYHQLVLSRPEADRPTISAGGAAGVLKGFFETFGSFFRKPGIAAILAFLLLFRFAEAQLVKIASLFLLDSREVGGLGLTTGDIGFVYGTVGVVFLMAGGLLGGYVISRHGLKFWLWPMVCAIHLPDAAYVYLAYVQPESMAVIMGAVAFEQFGYGFGFSAYMLYMILVAQGPHKTAHYAICTGFMAMGMMIPGMFSGWLQELIGYERFFIWVMISTIPGFIVAAMIRIDPEFGKKKTTAVASSAPGDSLEDAQPVAAGTVSQKTSEEAS